MFSPSGSASGAGGGVLGGVALAGSWGAGSVPVSARDGMPPLYPRLLGSTAYTRRPGLGLLSLLQDAHTLHFLLPRWAFVLHITSSFST